MTNLKFVAEPTGLGFYVMAKSSAMKLGNIPELAKADRCCY